MSESLIWSMMNDRRNTAVIIKENEDLKNFIPKTVMEKVPVIEVVENIEEVVKNILECDYSAHNALMILQNQSKIASYLVSKFKKTEPENIDWNNFRPGLQWILESSEFILEKVKLTVNTFPTDKVYRSSYKFCISKENCNTMYNNILQTTTVKRKSCSGDHYVHNKIVQDLRCLITVMDSNVTTIFQDLRLGLNTLSFVISHMYQELNIFQTYLGNTANFNINKYYNVKPLLSRSDNRHGDRESRESHHGESRHGDRNSRHRNYKDRSFRK